MPPKDEKVQTTMRDLKNAQVSDVSDQQEDLSPDSRARRARLVQLQLDDLGLARASHITEMEDRGRHSVRPDLAALEARRAVNVPGTAAYEDGQRNREQLNAWSNAFLELQDDGTSDGRADLGEGQSHRLGLMTQYGGPMPAATRGGAAVSSRGRVHRIPSRLHGAQVADTPGDHVGGAAPRGGRGARAGGRGGGVAGTRGRGDSDRARLDAELSGHHPQSTRTADNAITAPVHVARPSAPSRVFALASPSRFMAQAQVQAKRQLPPVSKTTPAAPQPDKAEDVPLPIKSSVSSAKPQSSNTGALITTKDDDARNEPSTKHGVSAPSQNSTYNSDLQGLHLHASEADAEAVVPTNGDTGAGPESETLAQLAARIVRAQGTVEFLRSMLNENPTAAGLAYFSEEEAKLAGLVAQKKDIEEAAKSLAEARKQHHIDLLAQAKRKAAADAVEQSRIDAIVKANARADAEKRKQRQNVAEESSGLQAEGAGSHETLKREKRLQEAAKVVRQDHQNRLRDALRGFTQRRLVEESGIQDLKAEQEKRSQQQESLRNQRFRESEALRLRREAVTSHSHGEEDIRRVAGPSGTHHESQFSAHDGGAAGMTNHRLNITKSMQQEELSDNTHGTIAAYEGGLGELSEQQLREEHVRLLQDQAATETEPQMDSCLTEPDYLHQSEHAFSEYEFRPSANNLQGQILGERNLPNARERASLVYPHLGNTASVDNLEHLAVDLDGLHLSEEEALSHSIQRNRRYEIADLLISRPAETTTVAQPALDATTNQRASASTPTRIPAMDFHTGGGPLNLPPQPHVQQQLMPVVSLPTQKRPQAPASANVAYARVPSAAPMDSLPIEQSQQPRAKPQRVDSAVNTPASNFLDNPIARSYAGLPPLPTANPFVQPKISQPRRVALRAQPERLTAGFFPQNATTDQYAEQGWAAPRRDPEVAPPLDRQMQANASASASSLQISENVASPYLAKPKLAAQASADNARQLSGSGSAFSHAEPSLADTRGSYLSIRDDPGMNNAKAKAKNEAVANSVPGSLNTAPTPPGHAIGTDIRQSRWATFENAPVNMSTDSMFPGYRHGTQAVTSLPMASLMAIPAEDDPGRAARLDYASRPAPVRLVLNSGRENQPPHLRGSSADKPMDAWSEARNRNVGPSSGQ